MRMWIGIVVAVMLASGACAEMRSWTLRSGETVKGEYERTVFNKVVLKDADGNQIKVPLDALADAELAYLELINPPELSVDLLKSVQQEFVKPSPIWVENSPVNILQYTFGARVRQKDTTDYRHPLTVEIYAISQQVYDPDKYHLVYKWTSDPFILGADNNRRREIQAPKVVELAEFRLAGEFPRGESYAESILVVRDERGEVVGYNSTKNWLMEHLAKIDALPVGAWFDKKGRRVHPTSPKPVWFD